MQIKICEVDRRAEFLPHAVCAIDQFLMRYATTTLDCFECLLKEASTRAGLLLEQAAYCYLRTAPPMLRKYGFHLVLAGNQYSICFQVRLFSTSSSCGSSWDMRWSGRVCGLHVWHVCHPVSLKNLGVGSLFRMSSVCHDR